MSIYYLAAPYSGTPEEVEVRMESFCRIDAKLMALGYFTVSPLQKHFILRYENLPGSWEYWKEYGTEMLKNVTAMMVITMPGWDTSVGVQDEIEICKKLGKAVFYIDPDTLVIS